MELQPIISLNSVQTMAAALQERESNEEDLSSSSTDSPDVAFSFSSDSSSDDFIQVDHPILIIPKPPSSNHDDEETTEGVVSNLSQLKLEELFLRSSSTNSRISDVTIESYIPDVSPTQSPPLQVMEKKTSPPPPTTTTDFDPDRIPSSIFGKPSSPLDWSVASNESLFSIHVGSYSFAHHDRIDSIDECYSFREMYNKSGELTNPNNVVSEANDTPKTAAQNVVSCKGRVLEEGLVNIPKKSMINDDLKMKAGGGFEDKKDNFSGTGVKLQSYPHPIKQQQQSRCCCEWLTCQRCSCNGLLLCCWPPNWCPKCDLCFCCKSSSLRWCNCFSSCCCHGGGGGGCCCSSSSWTCSFRQLFCCFSNQRSRNLQTSKASSKPVTSNNRCNCCFSYPCCCN